MKKLSYEEKIELYNDYKSGMKWKELYSKYEIKRYVINYTIKIIDKHGVDILKPRKNNRYSSEDKKRMINRVLLNNESIYFVSIDEGLLNHSMLSRWVKKCRENGYNIVERKRGRPTMKKITKQKTNETQEEKIKRLEEENLYLKAELEYSKKLRAVVQQRKNRQQKKK